MWNLINKTNKQANITKDTEIRNKLTVTRAEVGGDNEGEKGGRFSGTGIKDTWTKPKGHRSEGGTWGWLVWGAWRGETGDNCT